MHRAAVVHTFAVVGRLLEVVDTRLAVAHKLPALAEAEEVGQERVRNIHEDTVAKAERNGIRVSREESRWVRCCIETAFARSEFVEQQPQWWVQQRPPWKSRECLSFADNQPES